jgi:hypothetical protein
MKNVVIMKKCSKCTLNKDLAQYVGKNNHCLECRRKYKIKYEAVKKSEDLAIYQLKSSARNVYKRGQENYTIPPYENVRCGWNRIKNIVDDLLNDKEWIEKWRKQTAIFEKSGDNSDKPSIGRIGDVGDYTRDNIIVQSLKEGSIQANAKPCYILEIRDKKFGDVKEFESIKNLRGYLQSLGVPVNAISNLNTGRVHKFGNGLSIIIQTKYGEIQQYEVPQYSFNIVHRKLLIDNSRNIDELLERNNYVIPVNRWALTLKKIQIGNRPSA